MATTIFDGRNVSSNTAYDNYELRLLVEHVSYNSTTNTSEVRFRLWLDAFGTWWWDQWAITGNVDYATFNASGTKGTTVEVWNAPGGNQTQGSPGANKLWADVTRTISHDVNGMLRLGVRADFKTNTAPSSTYNYLVAPLAIGSVNSINTTTVDYVITPSAPTVNTSLTSLSSINSVADTATLTITSNTSTTPSGGTPTYQYSYSTTSSSTGFSTFASMGSAGDTNVSFSTSPSQRHWVKVRAIYEGTSAESAVYEVAGIPDKPTITDLSKNVRKITINWTAADSNGSTVSGYTVQGSYDDFATVHYTATVSGSTTLTHTTSDLDIAKTYKFRVFTLGSVGNSNYSTVSSPVFISAYGYRRVLGDTWTATQNAKIYVGIGGPGADENGFRIVQNVKRYTESGWIDLQT